MSSESGSAEGVTIAKFSRMAGVHPNTFRLWKARGFAPRATVLSGGRWPLISAAEVAAWMTRRDADQDATGKFWLKHPLKPNSWFPDAEVETMAATLAAVLPQGRAWAMRPGM